MKNMFHEMVTDIKECKNERELLRVATYITENRKKMGLDQTEVDALEQIGINQYERFRMERETLIRNKKQGFNNFGD